MRIFRFPLKLTEEIQKIEIPQIHNFLCVQNRDDKPTLYYSVNTNFKKVTKRFIVIPTGIEFDSQLEYLGTVKTAGEYFWHIFEIPHTEAIKE